VLDKPASDIFLDSYGLHEISALFTPHFPSDAKVRRTKCEARRIPGIRIIRDELGSRVRADGRFTRGIRDGRIGPEKNRDPKRETAT
jgi:hypothetical protein